MDTKLEKAHRRARTSSLVAALLMFAIAALCAALLALYLYAQSRVGSCEYLQHGWIENKLAALTLPVLASLLFASFFLHIHRSEKPFGSSPAVRSSAVYTNTRAASYRRKPSVPFPGTTPVSRSISTAGSIFSIAFSGESSHLSGCMTYIRPCLA